MQNHDYFLPGVAAIILAAVVPIYWVGLIASQTIGDSNVLGQNWTALELSDAVFALIPLLSIYIYLNLKKILNEQLNFNHIDLLVLIMVAANAIWLGTLCLDLAAAVLPEQTVMQNQDIFLGIGLSVSIGVIILCGILDLVIGILLLANSINLPTLLKIFAVMSVIQGVIGITVVFAAALIVIFPITLIVLAMFFLRKPESIEIV